MKNIEVNRLSYPLSTLARLFHILATAKGWHEEGETEDQFIERCTNNLHDEISELHEAWRRNKLHEPCDKAEQMKALGLPPLTCIEEEFADIIIRVLDNCCELNVNIERAVEVKYQFNQSRPFKHGGKKS